MSTVRQLRFGSSTWIDVTDGSDADLKAVLAQHGMPESTALDCLDPSALPKFQRLEPGTFLLLRGFDEKASAHATTAQGLTRKLAILMGEQVFLTVHRAPMLWVDGVWTAWEKKNRQPSDLARVLHDLVEECLFTYELPIDRAAEDISVLEEKIFAERSTRATPGHTLETAYVVKKRASTFKRLLRLTRDVLPSVTKLGEGLPVQALKEEADRLFFYADDLTESANDLVQLSISMSSNRMNELVRLLTIVSLFLLPLNLITGIYGMNFEAMPELKKPWAYPATLAGMGVIVAVTYGILRRRGWIRTRS